MPSSPECQRPHGRPRHGEDITTRSTLDATHGRSAHGPPAITRSIQPLATRETGNSVTLEALINTTKQGHDDPHNFGKPLFQRPALAHNPCTDLANHPKCQAPYRKLF